MIIIICDLYPYSIDVDLTLQVECQFGQTRIWSILLLASVFSLMNLVLWLTRESHTLGPSFHLGTSAAQPLQSLKYAMQKRDMLKKMGIILFK